MAGLIVKIGADTKELRDAIKGSRSALKSLGRQMDENITQAAKYGAAAAAAGAAIGVGLTVKGLRAVDAQAKLAKQLNTTSSSMATVARAGELSGISIEKINASATRLTRRLSLAEAGAGPAADAIERLGLNAAEVANLPLDQRIATVNRAINEMIPAAEQAGVATQLFGEEAGIAMRSLDAEVLAQARREAERFGTAISDVDAAKVEAANDAFSQLGVISEGVQTRLAVSLSSTITAVSNQLAREFGDSSESMQEGIDNAVEAAVDGLADILDGAANVTEFISGNAIMSQFGILGYVVLGPKGALLGAAIGATFDMIKEGLANFGVGISEGEDQARRLVNVQEEIARQTEIIGKAAELGHGEQSRFVQDARAELERLRATESELLDDVESSSETQAIYNDIINKGTDKATGLAGALRRLSGAMRESRDEAAKGAGLGLTDGRGENTPDRPLDLSRDGEDEDPFLTADEIAQREEEKAKARLEKMQEAFNQEALLTEEFNLRMAELRDLKEENDSISEDEYQAARLDKMRKFFEEQYGIQSSGYDALANLASKHWDAETGMAVDALGHIVNAFAGESKKMFEIQKAAGIANAVISTYEGASAALKLGWPLGPIAAAAITANGFAKVQSIRAQTFGGGGGGGAASGGGGLSGQSQAVQQTEEVRRSTSVDISLIGADSRDRAVAGSVIEQLNEEIERGGRISRVGLA